MKLTREELLKQKALVEQQLRWIDAKLAETEQPEVTAGVSTPVPPVTVPESAPVAGESEEKPDKVAQSDVPVVADQSYFPTNDTPEGVTGAQKVGCVVLVIIVCAGILAGLFVLPYLLY